MNNQIMKPIKKEYSMVKYIHHRIKSNKNFICTITGPTGSGKSWTALSIGELLDDDFFVDRIVFSAKDLMELVNSGKLESGSVILWDEAGIDLSNRNWQSMTNKMINFLLQTFRHKNFILIFTVPYHDFVDTSTRKLFHAEFETVSVNHGRNTCRIKPKLLQYNSQLKKWYQHYLKVIKPGEGTIKITRWDVPKPSKLLIDAYERKKSAFTASLNKEISTSLKMLAKDGVRRPLTDRQRQILECWEDGLFNQRMIGEKIGVIQARVSESAKRMRNKGYFIEEYQEIAQKRQVTAKTT